LFLAPIFGLVILPALGYGWFDYFVTRQVGPPRRNILLIALCVSSLSVIALIGTALALKFEPRHGNLIGALYFRLAAVGALLSFVGVLLGTFTKPWTKKLLFVGVGLPTLLLWIFLAIIVLPVS
jgi:hypothetical protein